MSMSYAATAAMPTGPWRAPCVSPVVFIQKLPDNAVKGLAFTMLGLGGLMAFVCTFRQPFNTTGNGYFGAWLGLVAAMAVSVPLLPDSLKNLIHPDHVDETTATTAKVMPA